VCTYKKYNTKKARKKKRRKKKPETVETFYSSGRAAQSPSNKKWGES